MCDWVTMLYSRKLTEHCKPAIMEKSKNHYIKKDFYSFFFSPLTFKNYWRKKDCKDEDVEAQIIHNRIWNPTKRA